MMVRGILTILAEHHVRWLIDFIWYLCRPGGWPHCVVTPEDSVVLGGNFLTGYNLPMQLDIYPP